MVTVMNIQKSVMREIERAGYVDMGEIAQRLRVPEWHVWHACFELIRLGKLNPPEGMDFLATGNSNEADEWANEKFGHAQAHETKEVVRASKARGETLEQALRHAGLIHKH